MKKIILTFLVLLISISYNQTYANESACKIKNKSSEALLDYISNNRAVVRNITTQISLNTQNKTLSWNFTNEYDRKKWSILRVYNQAFDFNWYFSYFKYYAVYPISNEVPYEVKRDYSLLEKEWEWLKFLLEKSVKNNSSEIKLNWLCNWISVKCNLSDWITVENALWILIKNNSRILDLYRNVVIWEKIWNYSDITLVSNNFELDIETNYNNKAYWECSNEWWFFERISDSIKNISILNQEWKDWIKKWKDAINLLLGKDVSREEYEKIEKELLRKELSRQWVYWDNQTNVLNALEKYNQDWGFSQNNNFLYNTFKNNKVKLEKKLREFKEEVIWDFFRKKEWETITVTQTNTADKNAKNTTEIKERVDALNLELSSFAWISEVNTDNLRSRLINIHISISNSINTLNQTCKMAVEACNQQWWWWNCGSCN